MLTDCFHKIEIATVQQRWVH